MYVRKFAFGWATPVGVVATALLFVAAAAMPHDVHRHSIFTRDGYVRSPVLPWGSEISRSWSDAKAVELGCTHVTGKNASDDVIYRVDFADEDDARIDGAEPIGGSWLDQAEILDARFRDLSTPFKRCEWLKRNPLHPACLAAWKRRLNETDYRRLKALLRVGQMPGDPHAP
jgi:hypothetical protein